MIAVIIAEIQRVGFVSVAVLAGFPVVGFPLKEEVGRSGFCGFPEVPGFPGLIGSSISTSLDG